MKKTNPSKAQLRQDNERLQRAAKRANDAKVDAWTQVRAAQRQRDLALQILSEISPDLAALLTRPDLLPLDQRGLEMVRMPPRFDAARMLRTIEARAYEPNRLIERVREVKIHATGQIELAGRYLTTPEMEAFARADGFADLAALLAWFHAEHGLPFTGILIEWNLSGPVPAKTP